MHQVKPLAEALKEAMDKFAEAHPIDSLIWDEMSRDDLIKTLDIVGKQMGVHSKITAFYSQPFKPEMLGTTFVGWELNETNGKNAFYIGPNESELVLWADGLADYSETAGNVGKVGTVTPTTIGHFAIHCDDAGIPLHVTDEVAGVNGLK